MKANSDIRHSVRAVQNCRFDLSLRIGRPCIQLGARYANQTAGHVDPERVVLVLRDPKSLIARQAILAGQCYNTAILDSAYAAIRCRPNSTIGLEAQRADPASAEPFRASVALFDLTVAEIRDSTLI